MVACRLLQRVVYYLEPGTAKCGSWGKASPPSFFVKFHGKKTHSFINTVYGCLRTTWRGSRSYGRDLRPASPKVLATDPSRDNSLTLGL